MGVGRLDIGEGIGGAQVFNPMTAIQQYGQMLQQRQAKHDTEVKQLGDELAKGYDPAGLRNDADRKEYIKQYGGIRDDAIAIENEKDPTKKALGLAQIRQRLSDLGAFSEGSKKYATTIEQPLAKEHALHPYSVSDDTFKKLMDGNQRVWNDPANIKSWADVERGVDPNKEEAEYQKANENLSKSHPATYGPETIRYGESVFGRKTATGTSNRIIPYHDLLETQSHRATADLDYQKSLANRYGAIKDPNPQVQLAKRVAQDIADHNQQGGLITSKTKEYEDRLPQEPVRPSFLEQWNMNHNGGNPNAPSKAGAGNTSQTYRQKMVSDMLDDVPGSGTALIQQVHADPTYNGNLTIFDKHKPDGSIYYEFHVPEKIKWDKDGGPDSKGGFVTQFPAHVITIDPKKSEAKSALNKLLNDVTGEKVDISALETPGGKKHVGGGGPKGGMVTVKLPDGRTGQIPSDKYDEFLKDNPKAQKVN